MTERERPEPRFNYFSFICPGLLVESARTILQEIPGVNVDLEVGEPGVRMGIGPNGVQESVQGINMSGLAQQSSRGELVRSLAEARIAGYSKLTEVRFTRINEFDPDPLYKPRISFQEDTLIVEFDEGLSAPPDELDTFGVTVTCFGVHPERELYVGLLSTPKHILLGVANGLGTYKDDETLTPEQKSLVNLGVSRLHDLLNQDN